jgi:hypothetical protein
MMTAILKLDQQLQIRFRNYQWEGQLLGEVHFKTVLFVSLCPTFPYSSVTVVKGNALSQSDCLGSLKTYEIPRSLTIIFHKHDARG